MSTAADRQRRHRERELAGRLVVSVEVDADTIELLVAARLLSAGDFHDRADISEAIQKFLLLARRA